MLSPAVEDAPEGVERPAGLEPRLDFRDARVRIIGVRQHEHVELHCKIGTRQRLVRCTQPGEHPRHVLVADRHHHRSAHGWRHRRIGNGRSGDRIAIVAGEDDGESGDRRPETGRHPAEQNGEQRDDADLERFAAVVWQHRGHETGGQIRLRENEADENQPTELSCGLPVVLVDRSGGLGRPRVGARCADRRLACAIAGPRQRGHRRAIDGRCQGQARLPRDARDRWDAKPLAVPGPRDTVVLVGYALGAGLPERASQGCAGATIAGRLERQGDWCRNGIGGV